MQELSFIKEIVFKKQEIDSAIDIVANDIVNYYRLNKGSSSNEIIVLSVMEGAKNFSQQLLSVGRLGAYGNKFKNYDIKASSYVDNKKLPNDEIRIDLLEANQYDWVKKNILIIDDIYDTGNTLNKIVALVKRWGTNNVQCAVLLEREVQHKHDIDVRFVGLKINTDDYLVGYAVCVLRGVEIDIAITIDCIKMIGREK